MRLIGRRSSVFTRIPRVLAHELGVPLEVEPVYDMTALDPAVYADNPAMKLPSLENEGAVVFGAVNICRVIAESAGAEHHVVWPEDVRDTRGRNAHELVFHGLAAQVQLAFGTQVCKLPADNVYFVKASEGLVGSLRWLDANLEDVVATFQREREHSILWASRSSVCWSIWRSGTRWRPDRFPCCRGSSEHSRNGLRRKRRLMPSTSCRGSPEGLPPLPGQNFFLKVTAHSRGRPG